MSENWKLFLLQLLTFWLSLSSASSSLFCYPSLMVCDLGVDVLVLCLHACLPASIIGWLVVVVGNSGLFDEGYICFVIKPAF